MKKKIITYGTFDSFHLGHKNLINKCLPGENDLFVGVASDKYVKSKGKEPLFTQEERMHRVSLVPGVKKVILEEGVCQWENDYNDFSLDRIIMGSDHIGELDYFITEKNLNLSYISRTKNISTTEIKKELKSKKVALVYLDNAKRNWEELIIKAKRDNDIIILGLIEKTFDESFLHQKIVDIEELFNPFLVYLVNEMNSKDLDMVRFNVSNLYY